MYQKKENILNRGKRKDANVRSIMDRALLLL